MNKDKSISLLFWIVFTVAGLVLAGIRIYESGREAARHDCAPPQSGEKLLSIEHNGAITVCYYAEGEAAYGHTIRRRFNPGRTQS